MSKNLQNSSDDLSTSLCSCSTSTFEDSLNRHSGCDNEYYPCCGKNTECVRVTNASFGYGKCVRKSITRCDDDYHKCCPNLYCNRDTHADTKYGNCLSE
uniref:Uncharacterized protein n=1 Tax=Meloidogyne floridensis TaxID=298350 RepID=A0A915NIP1_9BILA